MRIDNSAALKWFTCPTAYRERYEANLELAQRDTESLDFGTRWHTLQSERNLGREFCSHCGAGLGAHRRESEGTCEHCAPLADARLEAEAQATFQAYLQHYGHEARDIVDVERTLIVPLPIGECPRCHCDSRCGHFDCGYCQNAGRTHHELAFKIDLIFREPGGLAILDYKTEKRGSSWNTPEAWVARSQVALYQWAAERHYHEPVVALYLDVTTRQSPKGLEPPLFQRQRLVRTVAQREAAVRNIIWVADQIEASQQSGFWPQNTESCKQFRRLCQYYQLCHIGRTDANLRLYQIAKPYLDL